MGRHRHAPSVRDDGLAVVLGALLDDRKVMTAALIDVDSGMVLDACSASPHPPSVSPPPADLDALGAGHAEVVRVALGVLAGGVDPVSASDFELVLRRGDGPHHLLQGIPDPHGDRVVLSVVVAGSARNLRRVRRRLQAVSRAALTAGPTASRRPGEHGWRLGLPEAPAPGPCVRNGAMGTGDSAPSLPARADEPTLVRPIAPIDVPVRGHETPIVSRPLPLPTLQGVEDHGRPAPPAALPPAR